MRRNPGEEKPRFHRTVLQSLFAVLPATGPPHPCLFAGPRVGPVVFSERCKKRKSPAAPLMQLLSRSSFSITGNFLEKVVNRREKKGDLARGKIHR